MNETLNIRVSDDLLRKIENELIRQKAISPGIKLTKSDVARNILELYFKEKEE